MAFGIDHVFDHVCFFDPCLFFDHFFNIVFLTIIVVGVVVQEVYLDGTRLPSDLPLLVPLGAQLRTHAPPLSFGGYCPGKLRLHDNDLF